jgi:uncharacterized BrkB/YihY/UPF0761 family membrane protein
MKRNWQMALPWILLTVIVFIVGRFGWCGR